MISTTTGLVFGVKPATLPPHGHLGLLGFIHTEPLSCRQSKRLEMAHRVNGHEAVPANGVDNHVSIWDRIEEQYWASTKAVRDREDAERQGEFIARTQAITDENSILYQERRRLLERLKQIDQQAKANEDKLRQATLEFEHMNAVSSHERAAKDEAKRMDFARQRLPPRVQAGPESAAQEAAGAGRGAADSVPTTRAGSPSVTSDHKPVPPPMNGYFKSEADTSQSSTTNGDIRSLPQRSFRPDSQATDAPRGGHWDPALQRQQHEHQQRSRNSAQHLIDSTVPSTPISRMSMEPAMAPRSHTNGARVESAPPVADVSAAQAINGRAPNVPRGEPNQAAAHGTPSKPLTDWYKGKETTGIRVLDGNGSLVDELHQLTATNRLVELVSTLPVQRNVQIRHDIPGFDAKALDIVYSMDSGTADPRPGSKWLACMIQATGKVQSRPCDGCRAGYGVFASCVLLEGHGRGLLPSCANCEWENRPCTGPAREHTSPDQASFVPSAPTQAASAPVAGGFTAVNASSAVKKVDNQEDPGQAPRIERRPLPGHAPGPPDVMEAHNDFTGAPLQAKKGRKSLPSTRHPSTAPLEGEEASSGTPVRPKAPRRKRDTNPLDALDAEAAEAEKQARWKELELDTINKDTLPFRDDGTVYTEPELMRGVPLEKITPDHPYWDPAWPSIEEQTRPQLEKWQEKYQKHVDDPSLPQSSKFLAGRQVNRGKQILDFLENGNLHPYQIIGRNWMTKGLANYDIVYRLINTLQDLIKYKIDIEPHQWLRMRLNEIYEQDRAGFNLIQVVSGLYHDPKIQGIRERSGHGSIGRPSGYNMGGRKGRKSDGATKTPRGQKRKEPPDAFEDSLLEVEAGKQAESQLQQEEHDPATEQEQEHEQEQEPIDHASETSQAEVGTEMERGTEQQQARHSLQFGTASRWAAPLATQQKQQKTESSQQATNAPKHEVTTEEDLAYDGYTTVDSFSQDPVLKIDFRLDQVRTRTATTNKRVTQYWHWISGAGEFQHQVLSNIKRTAHGKVLHVSWGVYKDHDFHIHSPDVLHVAWAPGTLTVVIHKKEPKGAEGVGEAEEVDMLATFKRARTRTRFLAFLRRKNITVIKTNRFVGRFPRLLSRYCNAVMLTWKTGSLSMMRGTAYRLRSCLWPTPMKNRHLSETRKTPTTQPS